MIGRGHDHGRFQRAAEARQIEAGVDVRGVRRPHQHARARSCAGQPGKIGGAKIGGVELGARDLGDAVDAAARRWRPDSSAAALAASRALRNAGSSRRCQPRDAERNAARRHQLDELASRRPHAPPLGQRRHEPCGKSCVRACLTPAGPVQARLIRGRISPAIFTGSRLGIRKFYRIIWWQRGRPGRQQQHVPGLFGVMSE